MDDWTIMNKRVHSAVKILGQDWINPVYDTAIEELMISKEMPQTFAENSYAQPSLQGKMVIHDRCLNNKSTSNPSAYHKYKKEQVCHLCRYHHWVKNLRILLIIPLYLPLLIIYQNLKSLLPFKKFWFQWENSNFATKTISVIEFSLR